MANETITPNMGLPVPVPGVTPGSTQWANDLVADMSIIDGHNHSAGQGVAITPDGLNINADLPLNGNGITAAKELVFEEQVSASAKLDSLSDAGGDLYFTDGAGNQIRITQGGSVAGSTGTITGLPSGTASASFSAGTFTFQSATSTPATMAVGPIVVGAAIASSKTVTISPPNTLAANYALTLPGALPGSTSVVTIDSSGNVGTTTGPSLTSPTITTPTFSGAPSGTIAAGTYTPTLVDASGSSAIVTGTFSYTRIGNRVTVYGKIISTSSVGGNTQFTLTLPFNPTSNFSAAGDVTGVVSAAISSGATSLKTAAISAIIGTKTAVVQLNASTATQTVTIEGVAFTYDCT